MSRVMVTPMYLAEVTVAKVYSHGVDTGTLVWSSGG